MASEGERVHGLQRREDIQETEIKHEIFAISSHWTIRGKMSVMRSQLHLWGQVCAVRNGFILLYIGMLPEFIAV